MATLSQDKLLFHRSVGNTPAAPPPLRNPYPTPENPPSPRSGDSRRSLARRSSLPPPARRCAQGRFERSRENPHPSPTGDSGRRPLSASKAPGLAPLTPHRRRRAPGAGCHRSWGSRRQWETTPKASGMKCCAAASVGRRGRRNCPGSPCKEWRSCCCMWGTGTVGWGTPMFDHFSPIVRSRFTKTKIYTPMTKESTVTSWYQYLTYQIRVDASRAFGPSDAGGPAPRHLGPHRRLSALDPSSAPRSAESAGSGTAGGPSKNARPAADSKPVFWGGWSVRTELSDHETNLLVTQWPSTMQKEAGMSSSQEMVMQHCLTGSHLGEFGWTPHLAKKQLHCIRSCTWTTPTKAHPRILLVSKNIAPPWQLRHKGLQGCHEAPTAPGTDDLTKMWIQRLLGCWCICYRLIGFCCC